MLSFILKEIGKNLINDDFTLFQEFEFQLNRSDRERLCIECLKHNRSDLLDKFNLKLPHNYFYHEIFELLDPESIMYIISRLPKDRLNFLCDYLNFKKYANHEFFLPLMDKVMNNLFFDKLFMYGLSDVVYRYLDFESVTEVPSYLDYTNTSLIQEFLNRPKFNLSHQKVLEKSFRAGNYDFRHLMTPESSIFDLISEKSDPEVIIPLFQNRHFQLTDQEFLDYIFGTFPFQIRIEILRRTINPNLKQILSKNLVKIYKSKPILTWAVKTQNLNFTSELLNLFRLAIVKNNIRVKIFLQSHYYFTYFYTQVPQLIETYLGIDSYLLEGIKEDSLQWKSILAKL